MIVDSVASGMITVLVVIPLAVLSTLNFPLSTIILPLQGFGVLYFFRPTLMLIALSWRF
ncbi:MAG: hypothetical protein LBE12_05595 [Planctomycetaceae bacterium]|nr:hypothetical protein [Planctomycetaceae bacterium]